ncbi:cuticle protein 12.5-like [Coccinella septempunctata]|uniref:cuticle protein 12.5-like n=1 Tax=Coccinella septempunctata TaxID=41139 RepID=UPI001D098E74|nr:cuticle protein 12.5-like [Coccinella septempunctata]
MNSIVAVVFFAALAAASAGIVTPNGLIATSYAAPALAGYSAPLAYNAHLAYNAPLAYNTPLTYNAPLAYTAPLTASAYTAYSAPVATLGHAAESTVVAGPSGTITNTKSVATPAIAARYAVPSAYTYGGLYL